MKTAKTAVVVGATGNLGGVIVQILQDKGWKVDPQWLSADRPDVRDMHAFDKLPAVIDLAVYVAGTSVIEKAELLSDEDWQRILDVNLNGAFRFAKHAFSGMKAAREATFVVISSINAGHPYPGRIAYTTSKTGTEGLVRGLAVEWGEYGISTHAIRLGHLKGLMKNLTSNPKLAGLQDAVKQATPLGELIDPKIVASYILWLAEGGSRASSGNITTIDPGYTINRYPIDW